MYQNNGRKFDPPPSRDWLDLLFVMMITVLCAAAVLLQMLCGR